MTMCPAWILTVGWRRRFERRTRGHRRADFAVEREVGNGDAIIDGKVAMEKPVMLSMTHRCIQDMDNEFIGQQ